MRISDWSSDVCSSDLGDDDGGHHRAQADAAACGGEGILDRAGEPLALAPLLPEGLHDLHRAQRLRHDRANVGDPVLAEAGNVAKPAADEDRSEERRVGKEWVRTCRSRWAP